MTRRSWLWVVVFCGACGRSAPPPDLFPPVVASVWHRTALQEMSASDAPEPVPRNTIDHLLTASYEGPGKLDARVYQLESAAIPNAECAATFRARVEPCLRRIIRDHPGQQVAMVCHGGVIRMILAILLDLPLSRTGAFQVEYASITQVRLRPEQTELQLLNFTPWREQAA